MTIILVVENAICEAKYRLLVPMTEDQWGQLMASRCQQEIWLKWGWLDFSKRIHFRFFSLLRAHSTPQITSALLLSVCLCQPSSPTWSDGSLPPRPNWCSLLADVSFLVQVWSVVSCPTDLLVVSKSCSPLLTKVNSLLSFNLLRPL